MQISIYKNKMGAEFSSTYRPKPGELCVIIDSRYTKHNEIAKGSFGQGTVVKVIQLKEAMCSRPNAPKIILAKVQFQSGKTDIYPVANLRPK